MTRLTMPRPVNGVRLLGESVRVFSPDHIEDIRAAAREAVPELDGDDPLRAAISVIFSLCASHEELRRRVEAERSHA